MDFLPAEALKNEIEEPDDFAYGIPPQSNEPDAQTVPVKTSSSRRKSKHCLSPEPPAKTTYYYPSLTTYCGKRPSTSVNSANDYQRSGRSNAIVNAKDIEHDHLPMVSRPKSFMCVMCRTNRVGKTVPFPDDDCEFYKWMAILNPPPIVRNEIEQKRDENVVPQFLCTLHFRDGEPIDYWEGIREKKSPTHSNPTAATSKIDPVFDAKAERSNWRVRKRTYGGVDEEYVYRVEDLFAEESRMKADKLEGKPSRAHNDTGFSYLVVPATKLLSRRNEDLLRETRPATRSLIGRSAHPHPYANSGSSNHTTQTRGQTARRSLNEVPMIREQSAIAQLDNSEQVVVDCEGEE